MSRYASVLGRLRGRAGSTNQKIFAASVTIGCIGLMVKLVSLGNSAFIAKFFGISWQNSCFVVAFSVPMTLGAILSGSLNQVLIPTYVEAREREGEESARRLFTSMLFWNTGALLLVSGLLLLTDHWWLPKMASNFGPRELDLARGLMRCTLPTVLISGFTSMWGAALNTKERFGIVALGPIMQPSLAIIFMFAFAKQWGIFSLAYGTLLGSVFEAIMVGITLARSGHPIFPKWHGMNWAVRQVRAQYFACVAGAAVLSGTSIVDMGFSGHLSDTSIATLSTGIKIPGVLIGLMLTAVGTAVLPMFSQLVAQRDWKKLRRSIRTVATYLFVGSTVMTLVIMLLSPLIIHILFEHGKFTSKDTVAVSFIQRLSLLGVPVAVTLVPITRTFTALKANKIMSMVSVGSVILNAVADYVLMKVYGLPGIALATSVWMSVVGVTLFSILYFYLLPKAERDSPQDAELSTVEPPTMMEAALLDPYEVAE